MVIVALSCWWFYNNIIFQVNSGLCWVFCVFVMSSEPFAIKGASIHDFSKWRGGGGWPREPSQGQASVQIKQSHHLFEDTLWSWTIFTDHSRYGLINSFIWLLWYIDLSQDSNLCYRIKYRFCWAFRVISSWVFTVGRWCCNWHADESHPWRRSKGDPLFHMTNH